MIERRFWFEFEELVGAVLVSQGYEIDKRSLRPFGPRDRIREIDILARNGNGVILPVEVKLSMIESVPLSRLREASSFTRGLKDFAVKTNPLLVYGAYIEPSRRQWAEEEFQIKIWDRDILLQNAGPKLPDLERFFNEFGEQRPKAAIKAPLENDLENAAAHTELELNQQQEPQGEALIARLGAISSGKKDAKAYEIVCQDIISYLFSDDLKDGRSQKRTSDGLNIYDLVYRVSPKHPFWVTLTRDFRARVVLFECKNYGKPIGAMQVFTTERYLSASALRPICFVLIRKPPQPHAIQAALGAMRESGKLLVFLSDADLAKMLRARDAQLKEGGTPEEMQANDPTEVLDQTIYDFIAGLPR